MSDTAARAHELESMLARVESLLTESDALSAAHTRILGELERLMKAIEEVSAEVREAVH